MEGHTPRGELVGQAVRICDVDDRIPSGPRMAAGFGNGGTAESDKVESSRIHAKRDSCRRKPASLSGLRGLELLD